MSELVGQLLLIARGYSGRRMSQVCLSQKICSSRGGDLLHWSRCFGVYDNAEQFFPSLSSSLLDLSPSASASPARLASLV